MKRSLILYLASALAVWAQSEERITQRFAVDSGGKLVVDVEFGSITVTTHSSDETVVEVLRKIRRKNKAEEEQFLREHPVNLKQEGNTIMIQSRGKRNRFWSWRGWHRNEAKYRVTVPARFNLQLRTAGGAIAISDLAGEVTARTSGGGLRFTRVRGPLAGETSGGGIQVTGCEGTIKVQTSGGGIDVSAGSGALEGNTSGGSVAVKEFRGPVQVETSGGGISFEDVVGQVRGSTSGGSISARFSDPLTEEVSLETSGGGVTMRVAQSSAFDLDASTSGGGVSSDLPVSVVGKAARNHLKGAVNGGGKPVVLRTSGGSISVKKL